MLQQLELFWPLKQFQIAQRFGQNGNALYHSQGLMGHTGIDLVSTFNDTIMCAQTGNFYKAINVGNPDLMKYRCVFQIVELADGKTAYEVSYGHCNLITAGIGTLPTGTAIATEGNTGDVFVNGVEVTANQKNAGSKAGTHVHFQLRLCEKVTTINDLELANHHYLIAQDNVHPYQDSNGFYYHIVNYDNGFNGCIDPMPYINGLAADFVTQLSGIQKVVQNLLKFFHLA